MLGVLARSFGRLGVDVEAVRELPEERVSAVRHGDLEP
jgi:hypothetical protein